MLMFVRTPLLIGCLALSAAMVGCDASPVVPIPDVEDIPDIGTTRETPSMGGGGGGHAAAAHPKIDFGATSPVHKRDNIYLAGQPAEDDFKKIAEAGVTRVVSLCKEGEVSWDEKAAVEAAGMTFYHFPVASPDDLTPELYDKVREVLKESDENPTLLHCKGAVRAEAAFIPYWAFDKKRGIEGALKDVASMTSISPNWRDKGALYAKQLQDEAKAAKSGDTPDKEGDQ